MGEILPILRVGGTLAMRSIELAVASSLLSGDYLEKALGIPPTYIGCLTHLKWSRLERFQYNHTRDQHHTGFNKE